MYPAFNLVPGYVVVFAAAILLVSLPLALWVAPWGALRLEPARLHLVAGGALGCLLLWLLNIRIVDGLVLHLLGMTTLTLVVGWSLALLAGSVALLAMALLLGLDIAAYPVGWVFAVWLPATVSWALAQALYRPRLNNPFFYILGAGFAGGALVILLLAGLATLLFWLAGFTTWLQAMREGWPLLFLVMFSEGFINGMCISALAIFFPDWVKTFDDRFYLDDA